MHHLFLACPLVNPLRAGLVEGLPDGSNVNFELWLSNVLHMQEDETVRKAVALLWTIWWVRNDMVWNGKIWDSSGIKMMMGAIQGEWEDFGHPDTHAIHTHMQ